MHSWRNKRAECSPGVLRCSRKMPWSVELTFWLINTLLNAVWSTARESINSKRTYSISICLFAKSYKENVSKKEKKKDRGMCFYYMYAHQIPAL